MTFNLIRDPWIPVRRQDENLHWIRPDQVTEQLDSNPVVKLDAPRPDFNGALIQFLIGLLQTTATPQNNRAWRNWFNKPPPPKELQERFRPFGHAFNLDGDGPRFMQEGGLNGQKCNKISSLLIDEPGEQGLKKGTDFFIKRDRIQNLCLPCTATALFCLNINAPAGGRGNRVSLRGGGPLTTLIFDHRSFWNTLWLNILDQSQFDLLGGNWRKVEKEDKFPWLLPKPRTSEKNQPTSPEDTHPFQMFWGMPRRTWLNYSPVQPGACDLCGSSDRTLVTKYSTINYGTKYEGPWLHPLTPYRKDKDNQLISIKGSAESSRYRHWIGLVQEDAKKNSIPAQVITGFIKDRLEKSAFRVWAFGYDMDNMKPKTWSEGYMPLILCPVEIQPEFEYLANELIQAAEEISFTVTSCIKKAWFQRPKDAKGDISFIASQFWNKTEDPFYSTLRRSIPLFAQSEEELIDLKKAWLKELAQTAEAIFNEYALSGPFETTDPKRVAVAWNDLKHYTSETRNQKLAEILSS